MVRDKRLGRLRGHMVSSLRKQWVESDAFWRLLGRSPGRSDPFWEYSFLLFNLARISCWSGSGK